MQYKKDLVNYDNYSGLNLVMLTHLKETVNETISELIFLYKDSPNIDSLTNLISSAYDRNPIATYSKLNIEKYILPVITDSDLNRVLFELHVSLFSSLPLGEQDYFRSLVNQLAMSVSFSLNDNTKNNQYVDDTDDPFLTVYTNFEEVKKQLFSVPVLITYLCISLYFKPSMSRTK